MTTEVYNPTESPQRAYRLLMQARATNDQRDASDGHGYLPFDMQLRTAIMALVAGINQEDWSAVAEACCIVQDVELPLRLVTNTTDRRVV